MRIFAIRDEAQPPDILLGYLVYYENAKSFYIEIPDDADPWETPLLLSSFVRRGEHSINSYWSRIWVQQRIVPPDRQNITQILIDHGLPEYDEFSLLMLAMGRCEQDDCYLEEIKDVPPFLARRWQYKVEDVVHLENARMLVFFRSGEVRVVDIASFAASQPMIVPYLSNPEYFRRVEVQPDGYGVFWNDQAAISDRDLHEHGTAVPLSLDDFLSFVRNRVVSASEACTLLDCSRQNIDDLTRRGKLHPIRTDAKYKLFLRNEIIQRKKQ